MCRDLTKGTYVGKVEFCLACSREHFAGHFDTTIWCLPQFLTDLLRDSVNQYMQYETMQLSKQYSCCIVKVQHIHVPFQLPEMGSRFTLSVCHNLISFSFMRSKST